MSLQESMETLFGAEKVKALTAIPPPSRPRAQAMNKKKLNSLRRKIAKQVQQIIKNENLGYHKDVQKLFVNAKEGFSKWIKGEKSSCYQKSNLVKVF